MKLANRTLGAVLLVAGTAIGAGMLALPITTGPGGFWGALLLFLICFIFMLCNLFLLLEVNLYSRTEGVNVISMVGEHLGVLAQVVAWVSFLLILYAAAAAYIAASAGLLQEFIQAVFHYSLSIYWAIAIFATLLGLLVLFGISWIDLINRFLMLGLFVTYVLLIILIAPHVSMHHLSAQGNPVYLWLAAPIVVLSFTAHIIVPSLREYLHSNIRQLKIVLFWGSVLPLGFYLLWELFLLGALPSSGPGSLMQVASSPHPVAAMTEALASYLKMPAIGFDIGAFSFFAMATSFLGVILSLSDFLSDGLHLDKTHCKGRFLALLFTLLPPLGFVIFYPSGFVRALGYAGFLVTLLYGVLPALMVWKARYLDQLHSEFRVIGGRPLLLLVLSGAIIIMFVQAAGMLGWLAVT